MKRVLFYLTCFVVRSKTFFFFRFFFLLGVAKAIGGTRVRDSAPGHAFFLFFCSWLVPSWTLLTLLNLTWTLDPPGRWHAKRNMCAVPTFRPRSWFVFGFMAGVVVRFFQSLNLDPVIRVWQLTGDKPWQGPGSSFEKRDGIIYAPGCEFELHLRRNALLLLYQNTCYQV